MTRTRRSDKNPVGGREDANEAVDGEHLDQVEEVEPEASHHSNQAIEEPLQQRQPTTADLSFRVERLEEMVTKFINSFGQVPVVPPPPKGPPNNGEGSNHPPAEQEHGKTVLQNPVQPVSGPSRQDRGKGLWVPEAPEGEAAPRGWAKEMEAMSRKIDELSKGRCKYEQVEAASRHPFTPEVMDEPLPVAFRPPNLEMYSGNADPLDHLMNYNCSMALQGVTDAIMCRAFPSTLKGVARAWYSSLGPYSIRNFTELSQAFVGHFASSRRQRRSSASLMSIRQAPNESLRDYLVRFNTAAVEVFDLDQTVAVAAVTHGLRPSRLAFSLLKSTPANLRELMEKAVRHMEAEEEIASRRDTEKGLQQSKKRAEPERRAKDPRGNPAPRLKQVDVTDRPPQQRAPFRCFEHYTDLNTPRDRIFELEKNRGFFSRPEKMRGNPERRDKKKFCRYHEDHGHETEECAHLRDAIEELIRSGGLKRYIKEDKRP